MITLNDLQFLPGSMKKRKRVARGNSGKRAGRGFKGQKARTGVSLQNFQGGQTPLERRFPKHRSFFVKKEVVDVLPLKYLDVFLEQFGSSDILNKSEDDAFLLDKMILENFGLIKLNKKVKLIGSTNFKIDIEADTCSFGARESILKNNGKLRILGDNDECSKAK